ncbi:MAG: ankyrin repeat domain-containing protein [Tatlockia sp.]|nr:ankyrin repeat domain-containing protein [Tatlockia sp.]
MSKTLPNSDILYSKLYSLIKQRQEKERSFVAWKRTMFNFTDISGNTLLHYAAAMGDIEKVNFCLQQPFCNFDLKNENDDTPLAIALKNEEQEIAECIYMEYASCEDINLTHCGDNKALKAWWISKVKMALEESFPNPSQSFRTSRLSNCIFNKIYDPTIQALKRAVEINEINFIQQVLNNKEHPEQITSDELELLVVIAAKHGHLDMINCLIENNAHVNRSQDYTDTALIQAIKEKQGLVIDFLLQKDIDLEQKDNFKLTALAHAIISANESLTLKLIKMGASIDTLDIHGNTLLHLAVNKESNQISTLLTTLRIKEQEKIENIYGETPLDFAIQKKLDGIISLLSPELDLNLIRKSKNYGVQPTLIKQRIINNKMLYRFQLKYRDTSLFNCTFNKGGNCNGFSFLKSIYADLGLEPYFFDTLALMSNWDGTEESLTNEIHSCPQSLYYKNLDELFEQWTNDIIWFQHTNLKDIDDVEYDDRVKQFKILKSFEQQNLNYHALYLEPRTINKRTWEQFTEIFSYLKKMPNQIYFELSGDGHATSGYINKESTFVYYDSNFIKPTKNTNDLSQNIQRIIDFKYIPLNHYKPAMACYIRVFCFREAVLEQFKTFEIFTADELPTCKEEAIAFQKKSLNKFTFLHIAVITRSLATLKILLTEGYCDLYAKDSLGRTILNIALNSGFHEAVKLMRKYIDLSELDNDDRNLLTELLIRYASEGNDRLFRLVLNHCSKEIINSALINSKPLMIDFMINRKFHLIENLLEKGAYVDPLFSSGNTPLMGAIKNNVLPEKYDLIPLFVKYNPDLTIKNKEGKTAIDLVYESADEKIRTFFYEQGLINTDRRSYTAI